MRDFRSAHLNGNGGWIGLWRKNQPDNIRYCPGYLTLINFQINLGLYGYIVEVPVFSPH